MSLAALATFAACSGGGSGPSTVTSAGAAGGAATDDGVARILIPAAPATQTRGRDFVSPSVSSATIAVPGEALVVADLSAASTSCTTTAAGRACTIAIKARPGTQSLDVTLYAGPGGTGNILGVGTSTIDVSGNGFSAPLTISGQPFSLAITASGSFTAGTAGNVSISVVAKDAGGNTIVGSYSIPISFTSSDASAFTLTPASVTASNELVTLHYSGAAAGATDTISAATSSTVASAVTAVVIPISGGGATPTPTPSPTATPTPGVYGVFTPTYAHPTHLYVDNDTSGIYRYDLPLTSASTGTLLQSTDFDVWINFDTTGNMYLSQYSYGNGSIAPDTVYDLASPYTGSPVSTYTTSNTPAGVVVNAAGQVFIAQQDGNGNVLELASLASGTVVRQIPVQNAYSLALDSAQNLYIGNASGISVYAPPYTTLKQLITTVLGPGSIAVTNTGYIFAGVGSSITIIAPPYGSSSVAATITNGISTPLGIAGDASGNLYVPNYGNGTISAYAPPYTNPPYATINGSLPDAAALGP